MLDVTTSVKDRYSEGAKERQAALCCPVDYNAEALKKLPQEIIDKDYGCGDPSAYVREGDVVLDLGSGGGKICYMAADITGASGQVIGVDMNNDMLALARKYQGEMAAKLGYDNVSFRKGYIQDLALDVDAMERYLIEHPVAGFESYQALESWKQVQMQERPLIPDNSVDLVISNCVLNLVADAQKAQLVKEIYRVLKPGGRVAISDIISDEVIPQHLKDDSELWSGCLSGAFQEEEFLTAFRDAGFLAVAYDKWEPEAWQVIEGIEFRSATLTAVKGTGEACIDGGQAVIYQGPFSEVYDDEGHVYPRGQRIAVCERSFNLLTDTHGPYAGLFIGITPAGNVQKREWCAPAGTLRPAAQTKGGQHASSSGGGCC